MKSVSIPLSKQNAQKVESPRISPKSKPIRKSEADSTKTSSRVAQGRKRKLQCAIRPDNKSSNSNAHSDDYFLPAEKHRELVSSIFEVGVKESSPASILAHMTKRSKSKYDGLNLERIKSKLQKYRQSKTRNKHEFMELYDKSMARFCKALPVSKDLARGTQKRFRNHYDARSSVLGLSHPDFRKPIQSLSSGESAAFLSHSLMLEHLHLKHNMPPLDFSCAPPSILSSQVEDEMDDFKKYEAEATTLVLPCLSEDERNAPIGSSIAAFEKMFEAVKRQLYNLRAGKELKNSKSEYYPVDPDEVVAQDQPSDQEQMNTQSYRNHLQSSHAIAGATTSHLNTEVSVPRLSTVFSQPNMSTGVTPTSSHLITQRSQPHSVTRQPSTHLTTTYAPSSYTFHDTTNTEQNIFSLLQQKQQIEEKIASLSSANVNLNIVNERRTLPSNEKKIETQINSNQNGIQHSPYIAPESSMESKNNQQYAMAYPQHHEQIALLQADGHASPIYDEQPGTSPNNTNIHSSPSQQQPVAHNNAVALSSDMKSNFPLCTTDTFNFQT